MSESLKSSKFDKVVLVGALAVTGGFALKDHVPDAINPKVMINNVTHGAEASKFTDPKINEKYDKAGKLPDGVFEYTVTSEDKSATDIAQKIAANPEDMPLIRDEVSGQIGKINAGENVYLPIEQVK